tara:strand:+ start:306 stop:632 length:327 start_codon:yes stop_codon:yes gene_type:complete
MHLFDLHSKSTSVSTWKNKTISTKVPLLKLLTSFLLSIKLNVITPAIVVFIFKSMFLLYFLLALFDMVGFLGFRTLVPAEVGIVITKGRSGNESFDILSGRGALSACT